MGGCPAFLCVAPIELCVCCCCSEDQWCGTKYTAPLGSGHFVPKSEFKSEYDPYDSIDFKASNWFEDHNGAFGTLL